jgi:hypothetical protein
MRHRIIIVGIAATLALAGSSIALGQGAERRVPAAAPATQAQPVPESLVKVQRALAESERVRVRCGNIQCVNGALTAIGKAFRHLTGCMSYINVARYDGYMYSNDGGATLFQTTGLDEVGPGETGTKAAIFVC